MAAVDEADYLLAGSKDKVATFVISTPGHTACLMPSPTHMKDSAGTGRQFLPISSQTKAIIGCYCFVQHLDHPWNHKNM